MIEPINLRQLRYLVAVDDFRHFGQAAKACNVSQPSLSAQIRQVEERLGFAIFDRGRRAIEPTPGGQQVIARARRVLAEMDRLVAETLPGNAPLSGPFHLGVIPTIAPYLLPRILPALRRLASDLKLYLIEETTDRLLERLRRGTVDAAILALPIDEQRFRTVPLYDEPFLAAVPGDHRLATRETLSVEDLKGEAVLLLEDGHCFRDHALAVCRQAGTRDAGFDAASLTTLCEMVSGGLGTTLIPALAARGASEGRVTIPFAEPTPSRRVGFVWPDGSGRRRTAAAVSAMLQTLVPDALGTAVRPLPAGVSAV
ncbi:MAG: LysR substrate-binding domain-containing protein [Azospirillaceae bacterium]